MRLEDILKSNLKRYSKKSSGWIETFCPFCNDEFRKPNPNHGHLYISPDLSYFLCFRCNISGSISKLLSKIGLENIASEYASSSKRNVSFIYDNIALSGDDIQSKIIGITKAFINKYGIEAYKKFKSYVKSRSYKINHVKYLIAPSVYDGHLSCSFFNYDGIHVTTRVINHNSVRYVSPKHNYKKYYYFKDTIYRIIEFKNIVICEGAFDAINLSRFIFVGDDYFFISIQNSFFYQCVKYLCDKYLKYFDYTIHIVFDSDKVNKFNFRRSNIEILFYKPVYGKDVSELCFIEKI